MKPPNIFILTGAGISKESGLDTFRDADGIWAKYKVENVATPEGFARNPALVHEFYNGRRRQLKDVAPNAAHRAIAQLQAVFEGHVFLITQNIDDLHWRALKEAGASATIIHMHGELLESLCAYCGRVRYCDFDLSAETECVVCGKTGGMRPNIVWFGEMPYAMEEIDNYLQQTDIFISIGTSGNVYPAAGFVMEARHHGAQRLIELNLEPSEMSSLFTEHYAGKATEAVPAFVEKLIKEYS